MPGNHPSSFDSEVKSGCRGAAKRSAVAIAISLLMLFGATSAALTSAQGLSNAAQRAISSASLPAFPTLNPLLTLNASTPGYSNDELGFENSSSPAGGTGLTPSSMNCNSDPLTLLSFTLSKNFGLPSLKVEFIAETDCGTGPFQAQWVFGDGASVTQNGANFTLNSPPNLYSYYFYNHTYTSIGAYGPTVAIRGLVGSPVDGGAPVYVSFVPSLFYSFYNESGLIAHGKNGENYSIGIVDNCMSNWNYQSSLNAFDTEFDLPSTTLNLIGPGATSCVHEGGLWGEEASLDVEWAHVAAPGAKIYLCLANAGTINGLESCDLGFYQNRTVDNIKAVSNSWAFCGLGTARATGTGAALCSGGADKYAANWSAWASPGMNYFAASGDYAPNSCYWSEYPAADNSTIAVGGTTVTGVSSTGGYGSEAPWYNSTSVPECAAGSGGGTTVYGHQGELYTYADSSSYSYYAAPSWQHTVLGNSYRYFGDVEIVGNESTGVPIDANGTWYVVGGTSVGSPIWAGILLALISAAAPGLSGFAASFLWGAGACFQAMTNHGSHADGLGTPNIGCLSKH